jgi:hypothetical protein
MHSDVVALNIRQIADELPQSLEDMHGFEHMPPGSMVRHTPFVPHSESDAHGPPSAPPMLTGTHDPAEH